MPDPTDPLEAAWSTLDTDWENDARHRAFVGIAAARERLPDAAKRYRSALADDARKARAQLGLDRILAVAMQALTPTIRERRPRPIGLKIPLTALGCATVLTLMAAQLTGFRALASPWVIFGEALIAALIPWRRFVRDDGDE